MTLRGSRGRLYHLYARYLRAANLTTTTASQSPHAAAPLQPRSAMLRRELGITDLALMQIVYMLSLDFFGAAAKAGPSHVLLWIPAILFFFIPQALVVSHLNKRMPLEGGLYEWARRAFNEKIGFLVAWNLWLYMILLVAAIGLETTTYVAYAMGPRLAWIASDKWMIVLVSTCILAGLAGVSVLGLRVGKWVSNAGGMLTLLTLVVLILVPLVSHARGTLPAYHPLRMVVPPLSLFSFSVFTKMTFGALSGFEFVAIFAGETHNPARNIAKAAILSGPVIALLYILGTGAILAYVSPQDVNIIAAIPQALSLGFSPFGLAAVVAPVIILLLLANYLATDNLSFAASARLPMVAGWNHLLPEWFTRLHRKHKTPVNSILFVGAATLLTSTAVLVGVGEQEAFTLLQICGFAFYGIAYLAMFAIPILARKDGPLRPPWWLRLFALAGFAVTLLFVLLSVFPIVPVVSESAYAMKTVAVLLGCNLLGLVLFGLSARKSVGASDNQAGGPEPNELS